MCPLICNPPAPNPFPTKCPNFEILLFGPRNRACAPSDALPSPHSPFRRDARGRDRQTMRQAPLAPHFHQTCFNSNTKPPLAILLPLHHALQDPAASCAASALRPTTAAGKPTLKPLPFPPPLPLPSPSPFSAFFLSKPRTLFILFSGNWTSKNPLHSSTFPGFPLPPAFCSAPSRSPKPTTLPPSQSLQLYCSSCHQLTLPLPSSS